MESIKKDGTISDYLRTLNDLMESVRKTIQTMGLITEKLYEDEELKFTEKDCYLTVHTYKRVCHIFNTITEYINSKKRSSNFYLKEEIIKYLENNFHKDIQISEIAEKFNINSQYLSRFFKEQTGTTLVSYLNDLRINKAKQLLKSDKSTKISNIAVSVGFNSINHFIKVFRKSEGISPSIYREIINKGII